jgi:phospholipase/carboxylesterase
MFPIATAHFARAALREAGAQVVYREIADLSHTYPRDENPRILDWLTGS